MPYLTNETLFSLTELPRRLAVIGIGPIGCEIAQSFARFGSGVFVVEAMHGILPREDADVSAIVQERMKRDGVKTALLRQGFAACQRRRRHRPPDAESEGKGYDLNVDKLLVAAGRAPNVEGPEFRVRRRSL